MDMDIAMFLLAFAVLWETSLAIKCYRCLPEKSYLDKDIPLCEDFDYSAKFVKNCLLSTGCVKKSTELIGLGVTTKTVERDCAHQTLDGYQEKNKEGHWNRVDKIHEVYDEGCEEDPNEFDKPTKTIQCFCRGDLCNSADQLPKSGLALVTLVTLWIVFK